MPQPSSIGDRLIIRREHIDALFDALRVRGYVVVGELAKARSFTTSWPRPRICRLAGLMNSKAARTG